MILGEADPPVCVLPNNASAPEMCDYITSNCPLWSDRYLQFYYCNLQDHPTLSQVFLIGFFVIAIVVLFISLGILASDYLTPNLKYLANILHMDERMAGLTLLSLANGAPDISSTYAAMNSGATSLAIGELLGSANFELTIVIGCMSLVKPFKVSWKMIIRDIFLFSSLIILSIWFLSDGIITLAESITMISLYVLFIVGNFFIPEPVMIDKSANSSAEPSQLHPDHPPLTRMTSRASISMMNLSENVEELEAGVSYRLPLLDSLKLAFSSRQHHEANSLLESESVQPYVFDNDGTEEPAPPLIVTTDDTSDANVSTSTAPSNVNSTLLPPAPTRNSSYSSQASSGSFSSLSSERSAILEAAGISEETYVTYVPEKKLLFRIIPRWSDIYIPGCLGETLINVIVGPYSIVFNMFIPVPIPSPINQSDRDFVLKQDMALFVFQLPLSLLALDWTTSWLYRLLLPAISLFIVVPIQLKFSTFYAATLFEPLASFIGFVSVLNFIMKSAAGIVKILSDAGSIYHVRESLLGLTVLCLGNSVGDLVTDTTLASLGFAITGLHSCFGSPLLYTLLGIGLNSLIVNLTKLHGPVTFQVDDNLCITAASIIFTLTFYIVVVPLAGWEFNRVIGVLAISIWFIVTGLNVYIELA